MKTLRSGYTTGACAAAAAKAAALTLCGAPAPEAVEIPFPDGTRTSLPVRFARPAGAGAEAAVVKFAGDDPDITDGVLVVAQVERNGVPGILFRSGEGVGTVTKPGLQVPPGQPAINPAPRRMIGEALREVTSDGLVVTLSIPGGRALAARTFNPRLGIIDGLSILGTTGQVRPFSMPALRDALACALKVAAACGVQAPVLVPGNIGKRAAFAHFKLTPDQVIEVGNEWGFMLDQAAGQAWERLLLVGHPGKLAKLAEGQWDTHSSRSSSAMPFLVQLAESLRIPASRETATAEGFFQALSVEQRGQMGNRLAEEIRTAVSNRTGKTVAVMLVAMNGDALGVGGEMEAWGGG